MTGTRWWGLRLLRPALVASGLGYLLLMGHPAELGAGGWAIGLGAPALAAFGGRWPLAVALGQCTLLALTAAPAAAHVHVEVKAGVAAAFFELALRRWGAPTAVAGAALAAAQLAAAWSGLAWSGLPWSGLPGSGPLWSELLCRVPGALYRTAVVGGVPVLLAGYLRSAEQAARTAQERAREAEHSRDLAEWGARMGERAAIARELHDMVAHHLASTVLRVGVARHVLPSTDPRLAAVLDDVHAGATTALADLRRLLAALREPDAEHLAPLLAETTDLPAAVHGVVERSRRAGLRVDADIGGRLGELDAIGGLTVLRLVQEGLANVARHAGAGARVRLRATTEVTTEGERVRLELENELPREHHAAPGGVGGVGGGHGLLGMRERVALVGGTVEAGPVPGGWRLAASWPLTAGGGAPAVPGAFAVRGAVPGPGSPAGPGTVGAPSQVAGPVAVGARTAGAEGAAVKAYGGAA
ncbi:histidine kinase [Streptomyces sp. CB01881]|uniref:sensor histidine kinase n=1 Tax=Streptomyces sp. CB01881 TaxID=2078691 RepID=UPI000CDC0315|nr:histidine kinase [Streptomyces sp. CB01881]AUY51080.1 two-component sensor histidine kinase [Streptomyces sp. CB01881]TYC74463.1 two-component sensor histidine kinase [Streptomyces sp. CB01881]